MNSDLEIRRYIFSAVNSNMYAVFSEDEALIIDPNSSARLVDDLRSNCIKRITIILTHEHYDHTNGVARLQELFQSRLVCHAKCAEAILKGRNNRPVVIAALLMKNEGNVLGVDLDSLPQNYVIKADETFETHTIIEWCNHCVKLVPTPGHTSGSCCIELDKSHVFTGDSLLKDADVITRFPTGSLDTYNMITRPYLNSLSPEIRVMPGHGEPFLIKEV